MYDQNINSVQNYALICWSQNTLTHNSRHTCHIINFQPTVHFSSSHHPFILLGHTVVLQKMSEFFSLSLSCWVYYYQNWTCLTNDKRNKRILYLYLPLTDDLMVETLVNIIMWVNHCCESSYHIFLLFGLVHSQREKWPSFYYLIWKFHVETFFSLL